MHLSKESSLPEPISYGHRLLELAEQALRPVDQIDYVVRQCVMPVQLDGGAGTYSLNPAKITEALADGLRAELAHVTSAPVPEYLAGLLRRLDPAQEGWGTASPAR